MRLKLVIDPSSRAVTLSLTKDEVGALPTLAVRCWPRMIEHGNARR